MPVWALVVSTIAALTLGGGIAYGAAQTELDSAREETAEVQAQLDDVQSELDGVEFCVSTNSGDIVTAVEAMSVDNEEMWNAILDFAASRDLIELGDTGASAKIDHETDHDAAVASLIELSTC